MPRVERFAFDERLGVLERHVQPARGRAYVHRAPLEDVRLIAEVLEELAAAPFTLWDVASAAFGPGEGGTPAWTTKVAVVLAFAREECSLVERRGRAHVAVDGFDAAGLLADVLGFPHREIRAPAALSAQGPEPSAEE